MVVCFLSYLGLSMFATASGLLGVSMSLMLHDQHKQRRRGKVRQMAARLIQSWYRYQLASDERLFREITYYRKACAKLQVVGERIKRARLSARRAEERKSVKITRALLLRRTSVTVAQSPSPLIAESSGQSKGFPASAIARTLLQSGMPALIRSQEQTAACADYSPGVPESVGEEDSLAQLTITSITQAPRSHSSSQRSADSQQTVTSGVSRVVVDESRLGHYRATLRLIYFLQFMSLRRKFNRARKPYELLDAEAELVEMEHQRAQKFKELELKLNEQLGTLLEEEAGVDGQPANIQQRLDACERELEGAMSKVDQLHQTACAILDDLIRQHGITSEQFHHLSGGSPSASRHYPGAELPPLPPSSIAKRKDSSSRVPTVRRNQSLAERLGRQAALRRGKIRGARPDGS